MKNTLLATIVGGLFALAASSASAHDPAGAVHWGYDGKGGPAKWSSLDAANQACSISKEQSPINIISKDAKPADLPALGLDYKAGSAEVINNGHTIQVNLPAGSTFKAGSDEAALLQFHFHTPSEEKFNGTNYPMGAHFVHKSADGKLFVVAVLFKTGKENATLAPVFAALPAEGKTNQLASFDPAGVLPTDRSYYRFMGSLTTPPCSDGVRWQVLKQPVEISKAQLAAFRKLYKMNARPVQALNGRAVEVSK